MKNGTYNIGVWMPTEVMNLACNPAPRKIVYTQHAKNASVTDHYGKVPLPSHISVLDEDVVEVTIENNRMVKFVVRLPVYTNLSAVYVLRPIDNGLLCVTCWINKRDDNHSTLDKRKFIHKHA